MSNNKISYTFKDSDFNDSEETIINTKDIETIINHLKNIDDRVDDCYMIIEVKLYGDECEVQENE